MTKQAIKLHYQPNECVRAILCGTKPENYLIATYLTAEMDSSKILFKQPEVEDLESRDILVFNSEHHKISHNNFRDSVSTLYSFLEHHYPQFLNWFKSKYKFTKETMSNFGICNSMFTNVIELYSNSEYEFSSTFDSIAFEFWTKKRIEFLEEIDSNSFLDDCDIRLFKSLSVAYLSHLDTNHIKAAKNQVDIVAYETDAGSVVSIPETIFDLFKINHKKITHDDGRCELLLYEADIDIPFLMDILKTTYVGL